MINVNPSTETKVKHTYLKKQVRRGSRTSWKYQEHVEEYVEAKGKEQEELEGRSAMITVELEKVEPVEEVPNEGDDNDEEWDAKSWDDVNLNVEGGCIWCEEIEFCARILPDKPNTPESQMPSISQTHEKKNHSFRQNNTI